VFSAPRFRKICRKAVVQRFTDLATIVLTEQKKPGFPTNLSDFGCAVEARRAS
jgi:hypothetical protein